MTFQDTLLFCRVQLVRVWLVFGIALLCSAAVVRAQVVLDGKFGTSGALPGPNYNIGAGAGLTRGNNLFHSFSQFDLKAGDVATFTGPASVRNILSRVTGGSASSIDGTIRSGITGANFYFINPAGVFFGPNASIDVSGAFAASTANYLKLADDARFVAALDADDSMLSSAPVAAFGFLPDPAGELEVRGSLRSAPGNPLSVIGTTVHVRDGASLEALGSQINLMGVSGEGEVTPTIPSLVADGPLADLGANSPGTVVIRGGKLVIENAQVTVSGTGGDLKAALSDSLEVLNGGHLSTASSGATKGGDIVIHAPRLVVDGQDGPLPTRVAAETASEDVSGAGGDIIIRSESVDVLRGAEISVSSFGAADAGQVDITTGTMRVEGSDAFMFPTQISANAAPVSGVAFGSGGKIVVRADSVELAKFATISASTLGDPNAGSIDITARSISIRDSSVTTYSSGAGNGGDIRIESETLALDGLFGSITALAVGLNSQLPAGKGGNIDITTGSLQLLNDSAISASTYGDGNAGNIQITADSIVLDAGHPQPGFVPGISSSSSLSFDGVENTGNGGNVVITAGSLSMREGMMISVATATPGNGGNIHIETGSVLLDSQASIQSSSEAAGRAGTVTLKSTGDAVITGQASISTAAPLSSAGDVLVSSGSELRISEGEISALAGPGGGGNITVGAPSLIYILRGALDAQAVGDGGNLSVQTSSFVINHSGLISKSSSANGGNITLLSDLFLQSDSIIDASAPFGIPGTVEVSAPDVDLTGSLIPLPGNLLDAASQLQPDCAVRTTEGVSSFVILGRGGLPLAPGGFVPSWPASSADEKD